jgi:hypothetical protein
MRVSRHFSGREIDEVDESEALAYAMKYAEVARILYYPWLFTPRNRTP